MRSQEALQRRVLELCRQRTLSVKGLGDLCGITHSTLSNIVSGRNNSATIATIHKICTGLGMELPEFFDSDLFRDLEQEIY